MRMGLKPNDVVIGMDDYNVANIQELSAAKSKTKRGNLMEIKILRDGKLLELSAQIPDEVEYEAFPHNTPSGAIDAIRVGNSFYIKSSRIRQFALYFQFPNL